MGAGPRCGSFSSAPPVPEGEPYEGRDVIQRRGRYLLRLGSSGCGWQTPLVEAIMVV